MSTIDKLQNDLSNWYQESPVSEYWNWWTTGLKSFVPQKYQQQYFPQAIKIFLTQEQDSNLSVWLQQGKNIERDQGNAISQEQESEQWWHQVQHIINQADGKKIEVKYLLSNQQALVRKIALPQAAKENLDEVIGFELDKYVPFKTDQVQLAYKIDKENQNEDKILMDLAVIPTQKITDIIKLCDEKSIELNGIDVNQSAQGVEPVPLGVNLLPQENRKAFDFFNTKLNLALMVLLIGLIYFVMHISVANKVKKIDSLTNINTEIQKQARQSKLLRKELKTTIVSSKFLQNKKQNNPKLVVLMSEVTTILPDHTYLTKIKVDQEKLEITGMSDNANSLIPKLDESSNWYSPIPVGGFNIDRVTKKQKFTIKADLNKPKPEDGNDNNS